MKTFVYEHCIFYVFQENVVDTEAELSRVESSTCHPSSCLAAPDSVDMENPCTVDTENQSTLEDPTSVDSFSHISVDMENHMENQCHSHTSVDMENPSILSHTSVDTENPWDMGDVRISFQVATGKSHQCKNTHPSEVSKKMHNTYNKLYVPRYAKRALG